MEILSDNTKLDDLPEVLTAKMIAKYLSIGYTKALETIRNEGIPYRKLGNTYRVAKRNFEVWLLGSDTKVE